MVNKVKLMKVSPEFDNWLNEQLTQLIRDCEQLGIPKKNIKNISRSKITGLLTERLRKNPDKINVKLL